jgi:hypothetical protein
LRSNSSTSASSGEKWAGMYMRPSDRIQLSRPPLSENSWKHGRHLLK